MCNTLKVLHVYKTSSFDTLGGVENSIDIICEHTAKLGIENTVFALSSGNHEQPLFKDKHSAYVLEQTQFSLFSTNFSFRAFKAFQFLADKADILHFHYPNPFGDLLRLSLKSNKPMIVTYHSDIVRQKYVELFYAPLRKYFFGKADAVVCTSDEYLNSSKFLKKIKSKVSIIPLGLNIPLLSKDEENRFISSEFIKAPYVLYVGQFRNYKGLDVAIDAVKGTDIKLVLAGSGELEEKLRQKCLRESVPNVIFTGLVNDLEKYFLMQHCYCFLLPSNKRSEAFGMVLLEAASFSKPLVSCEIGTGTSAINKDGITGIVVPVNDPTEMQLALIKLIEDPNLAQTYGNHAFKHMVQNFSVSSQAKDYADLYNSIV